MNENPDAIVLTKALKDDIPMLVHIHTAAFAPDNAARLMFHNNAEMEKMVQNALGSDISNPTCSVIKAVSQTTGDILGWVGYARIGYLDPIAEEQAGTKEKDESPDTEFRKVVKAESARVRAEWMSRKKYIYIATLVTDPAHQGHGVGSALMHWVTAEADADGVPCWLQSTPVAHGLYYHVGFRDVGRLEVDLRQFAQGGKGGKYGWGPWESIYMLRLPDR